MNTKVLKMFNLRWFFDTITDHLVTIVILIGAFVVFMCGFSNERENSAKRDCIYLSSGESVVGVSQYFFSGSVLQVTSESGVVEYPSEKVSKVIKDCVVSR